MTGESDKPKKTKNLGSADPFDSFRVFQYLADPFDSLRMLQPAVDPCGNILKALQRPTLLAINNGALTEISARMQAAYSKVDEIREYSKSVWAFPIDKAEEFLENDFPDRALVLAVLMAGDDAETKRNEIQAAISEKAREANERGRKTRHAGSAKAKIKAIEYYEAHKNDVDKKGKHKGLPAITEELTMPRKDGSEPIVLYKYDTVLRWLREYRKKSS